MAARVEVKVLPIDQVQIEGFVSAYYVRTRDPVVRTMLAWLEERVSDAELDWPFGRERNQAHSVELFHIETERSPRGTRMRFNIRNTADYAELIHEPGNKTRLVVDRDLREPIEESLPDLHDALQKAFLTGKPQ